MSTDPSRQDFLFDRPGTGRVADPRPRCTGFCTTTTLDTPFAAALSVDFIGLSSYGAEQQSSGPEPTIALQGRGERVPRPSRQMSRRRNAPPQLGRGAVPGRNRCVIHHPCEHHVGVSQRLHGFVGVAPVRADDTAIMHFG